MRICHFFESQFTDLHQPLGTSPFSQINSRSFVNSDVNILPPSLKKVVDSPFRLTALYLLRRAAETVNQLSYSLVLYPTHQPTPLSVNQYVVGFLSHITFTRIPNQPVKVATILDSRSLFHFPKLQYFGHFSGP